MDYRQTTQYLFNQLPAFHAVGAAAYKPGLQTTRALLEALGNPYRLYPTVHVGGTNGKGSVSHSLAAVLQAAGYKVGLYTSPHLVDFRERIRVNGRPISEQEVVDFTTRYLREGLDRLKPSFFELATAMAMDHFGRHAVDVAVMEVGLGGRLDSTNVITPVLSVITNVSLDHTDLLGDTLEAIAAEKAGIIKAGVPAVVGEQGSPGVRAVFQAKADREGAPLAFADDRHWWQSHAQGMYLGTPYGDVRPDLQGDCQQHNMATVLGALEPLSRVFAIDAQAVRQGLESVCAVTGLMGRWQTWDASPLTICDTGHNPGAWQYLGPRLAREPMPHVVLGFCADKDVDAVLSTMPRHGRYYFTQAPARRAMDARALQALASSHGLAGRSYSTVEEAMDAARADALAAGPRAMVFVGGSTFVVAQMMTHLPPKSQQPSISR